MLLWFIPILRDFPPRSPERVSRNLSKTIGAWKRWAAKEFNVEWQRNFFDHRLRAGDSPDAKRQYILENPVRAALVEKIDDWPQMWRVPFLG